MFDDFLNACRTKASLPVQNVVNLTYMPPSAAEILKSKLA